MLVPPFLTVFQVQDIGMEMCQLLKYTLYRLGAYRVQGMGSTIKEGELDMVH